MALGFNGGKGPEADPVSNFGNVISYGTSTGGAPFGVDFSLGVSRAMVTAQAGRSVKSNFCADDSANTIQQDGRNLTLVDEPADVTISVNAFKGASTNCPPSSAGGKKIGSSTKANFDDNVSNGIKDRNKYETMFKDGAEEEAERNQETTAIVPSAIAALRGEQALEVHGPTTRASLLSGHGSDANTFNHFGDNPRALGKEPRANMNHCEEKKASWATAHEGCPDEKTAVTSTFGGYGPIDQRLWEQALGLDSEDEDTGERAGQVTAGGAGKRDAVESLANLASMLGGAGGESDDDQWLIH